MTDPRLFRSAAALLAMLATAAPHAAASSADDAFADHRGVWVSRFEYSTQAGIQAVIDRAAAAGFNEVFFQVRGQGDAHYDSNYEVWDDRYPTGGPGYDPLQTAIDRANLHGIDVHAWLNTMPMWSGAGNTNQPPDDPNHLYNQHPDWRLKDYNGNDQPIGSTYVGINPTRAGARQHIANVASDIISNYGVAGVHLDYIRMVNNTNGSPITYPSDSATRAQFTADTGIPFVNGITQSSAAYKQWIADNITAVVDQVNQASLAANPSARTTAAVWRDYDIGFNDYQQQADRWVEQGLLDANVPMIYTTSMSLYRDNLLKQVTLNRNAGVMAGLGSYLHDDGGVPERTLEQLEIAQAFGANGYTIFSYSDVYSGSSLTTIGQDIQAFNQALVARQAAGHKGLALTDFEDDEGDFAQNPAGSGSNIGIASATADLSTQAAYQGSQSQKLVINPSQSGWFLRHRSGDAFASPAGNTEIISQGQIGFWLMTLTEGVSVRLTIDDVEGTAERGVEIPVIADGQWHRYAWDLDDDSQWEGWVNGDGLIEGATVTMDSIQFFGATANQATLYLDNVSFNPLGALEIPSPATLALLTAAAPLIHRRRHRASA